MIDFILKSILPYDSHGFVYTAFVLQTKGDTVMKRRAESYADGFNFWDHFVSLLFCLLPQSSSYFPICSDRGYSYYAVYPPPRSMYLIKITPENLLTTT